MPVTPEQRYQTIAEAAYFRAEKRDFVGGDTALDWVEAEAEIDRIIQQPGKEPQMTEIQADYEKQLEILASKRDMARTKVLELRQRTEGAWEDLKGGAEKAWDEMQKALDRIASRFK